MLSYKILTFLLLIFVFLGFSAEVQAATFEEQVVSLINSERQKAKLSPLNFSDKLYQASLKHNTTIVTCVAPYGHSSCFKHQVTLLNEKGLMDRIKETGYKPQSVAENIAWGYTTPASVVTGWMNSSGHRAAILGSYKDIGCDFIDSLSGSYKGIYWTCDFGKSLTTVSTAPTARPTPTLRPSSGQATPTPTQTTTPSITPTINPSKPWYCQYIPSHSSCQ